MATAYLLDSRGSEIHVPEPTASNSPALAERKQIIEKLKAPFAVQDIRWRVVNKTKDKKRGQAAAYIKANVIIDRLNEVIGEGCWSRTYQQKTIENITVEVGGKTMIKGKVALICEIDIPGIGRNSGTGEMWSDDPNALTSADSQAFKRAAECFGIGLYIRRIEKQWVDLDSYGMPASLPKLAPNAIPKSEGATTTAPAEVATSNNSPNNRPTAQSQNANSQANINRNAGTQITGTAPTTTTNTSRPGTSQPAPSQYRRQMLEKKQFFIADLGHSLYDAVVAMAKESIPTDTAAEQSNQLIVKALTAVSKQLEKARALAGELAGTTVESIMDTYKVLTFDVIPSATVLDDILLALETAKDSQVF